MPLRYIKRPLIFTILWDNSAADRTRVFFSYFAMKIGSEILCKLSLEEKIYMKCQILFSG